MTFDGNRDELKRLIPVIASCANSAVFQAIESHKIGKSPMTMEYKQFAIEELKTDDTSRTIEGFAAVFNNVDQGNDMILPGAFTKTLKRGMPVMLWQHDTKQPIGVWDELVETDKGLYGKGTIVDTALGMDAHKLIKAKAVKGLSIGYATKKYEIDQTKGVRKLIELDLFEVSPVTFPMNPKATIARVKNTDGTLLTERQFEEFLRDVGELSQKEAKIVLSDGYKALLRHRDGGAQDHEDLVALRDALNQFKQ